MLGINRENQIEVELSAFIDPTLEFRNKEARVVFRMSRLGSQEFYQFDSYTLYVGLTDNYGRKEKAIRLAMPLNLVVSQKRRHVRSTLRGSSASKSRSSVPNKFRNPYPQRRSGGSMWRKSPT